MQTCRYVVDFFGLWCQLGRVQSGPGAGARGSQLPFVDGAGCKLASGDARISDYHIGLVDDNHVGRARHGNRAAGEKRKDKTEAVTHRDLNGAAGSVRRGRMCANSRGAELRSACRAGACIREATSSRGDLGGIDARGNMILHIRIHVGRLRRTAVHGRGPVAAAVEVTISSVHRSPTSGFLRGVVQEMIGIECVAEFHDSQKQSHGKNEGEGVFHESRAALAFAPPQARWCASREAGSERSG